MILFAATLLGTCAVMALTWEVARKVDNYSIVDGAWAFCFTFQAAVFASFGNGWLPRRTLIFSLVGLWSLRLGIFLARRIYRHHPEEDSRYRHLRREYEPKVAKRFFWFFQFQAWSVSLLSLPFLLTTLNPNREFSFFEWLGFALCLVSLVGEALADHQMSMFKAKPENRGKVCQVGLWRYSRHPNYFFESCVWWGFYLLAVGAPWGAVTIYCPLVILFLLLKVTGVPPAEAQSLQSRGEDYRRYQSRTSVFVPWFPKRGAP